MERLKFTDPHLNLYVKSMGKVFKVEAICHSVEEANELCQKNRDDMAVMAEDKAGHIYLCAPYASVCKSDAIIG